MKRVIVLLSCILSFHIVSAQQSGDKDLLNKHIKTENASREGKKKVGVHMQRTYNPIKLVLYVPLFLYQEFVSEQMSANCEFEPSCSNFGVQSIKQLGFIKGLFLTADRLTRCNGEAQPETKYYLIDHQTGKVIDEPAMYKFKD